MVHCCQLGGGLLDAVPDAERPGVYRRLGDVSLFLTGVFPDYVTSRAFGPVDAGRLLRAAGLPARYVSGYLHADPSAEPGHTVVGESHAWVEYWAGSWRPLDPTSGAEVSERHVVVARGRDYADIPPLKGIYPGAPTSALEVTVEVTRLA